MIHMAFRQGKRVLVIMRDGTSFVAKFKEAKSTTLFFLDHPSVETSNLRSATIYSQRTNPSEKTHDRPRNKQLVR